jgi:hypothetical protein
VALILLTRGNLEQALEIYAFTCILGHVANSVWFDDLVGKPIAEAAASLPPRVVAAARERGRKRDVQTTLEELIRKFEPFSDAA